MTKCGQETGVMTGEELKAARKRLGMSRSELARAIGSNHSTIGSWETGRHKVSSVAEKSIRDLMEAKGDFCE